MVEQQQGQSQGVPEVTQLNMEDHEFPFSAGARGT